MSSSDTPSGTRPHAILTSLPAAAAGPAFVAAGWSVDVPASRCAFAVRDLAPLQAPTRLVISFGRPVDPEMFEGQYQVEHLSLVLAIPHRRCVESALVADGPPSSRGARQFHWVTTITFSSAADLVTGLSSPAGLDALTHIATFATGGATATIRTAVHSLRAGHRAPASELQPSPRTSLHVRPGMINPSISPSSSGGGHRPQHP